MIDADGRRSPFVGRLMIAVLAALALVAVSCGDDDDGASPATEPSPGDETPTAPTTTPSTDPSTPESEGTPNTDDPDAPTQADDPIGEPTDLVAYVHEAPDAGVSEIWLLDLETGERRQLVDDGGGFNEGPSISPDGTRVSYESDRTGDYELYVVDIDGTNNIRLTSNEGQDSLSDWSPDGTRLAFESERDGDFEIYILDLATDVVTQVTDNDDVWDGAPAWSPDGTRIAFNSDRDGEFDVWVMGADGSAPTKLADLGVEPAWSPDGSMIAYDLSDSSDDRDIWIMNADGSGQQPLVATDEAWEEGAEWTRDGSAVLFTTDRNGTFHLHSVDVVTGELTELTTGEILTYEPSVAG